MTWQAWTAVAGVILSFVAMASGRAAADTSFAIVLALLVLLGVIPAKDALTGFSNEQVHTIALLFVVAAGLGRSGALKLATTRMLGESRSITRAVIRLTFPVALASSVLNNTPIVAMLLPEVRAWAKRTGLAPSQLLIPLSYAAILGGLITILGTSTNLVVNGLVEESGKTGIGFLEIGKIGVPIAIVGLIALIPISRWLLPRRPDLEAELEEAHHFVVEATVEENSPFVGKQLAHVRGDEGPLLLPIELVRGELVLPAPRADEIMRAGDLLIYSGPAAQVVSLKRSPGLRISDSHTYEKSMDKRVVVELVLSARARVLGNTVGDGSFRKAYNAAIIAVARDGGRVRSTRTEEWQLRQGDLVLVECGRDFLEQHGQSGEFYVITPRGEIDGPTKAQALGGLGLLLFMVGSAALGWLSMFEAALLTVAGLFAVGFVDKKSFASQLDLRLLLAIALAFGIGRALEDTGAAGTIASTMTRLGGDSPPATLCLLYIGTSLLTEIITNNAAAVIAIPLALASAERLEVSYLPFVVAVMVAASTSFATPLGYQTNLMVYGPGNYRFSDFLKAGLLMNLVVAGVALSLIPLIWPF